MTRAITIGTVIHLAHKNGYRRPRANKQLSAPIQIKTNTEAYALRIWLEANCDDSYVALHPYARKKGIDWAAGGARGNASGSVIGKNTDCLIVPIRNIQTNKVQGVQCINLEGGKQTFGSVSEGSLILGNTLNKSFPWYICEGWASAVSMVFHHLKGNGVCATSFGKSNLEKTAKVIAEVYEPEEIIILREDDS